MNWDDLRYFLAVASAGSLTSAAQHLGVNTTTVLRRVASLEEDLNSRLFDRDRTGYKLTEAGERLAQALEPVDQRLSSLQRDLAATASGAGGTVRLAVPNDFGAALLAAYMPAFREAFPQVEVEFVSEPLGAAAPRVSAPLRDVDMAVRLARPTQGDMLVRKLGDMAFGLYAEKEYLAARGRPAGLSDFGDHRVIGFPRTDPPLGPVWWLSRAERPAEIVMRGSSSEMRMAACVQGLGLAALPCLMGDSAENLERVLGPDHLGGFEIWLLTRNDLAQVAHVRAVMEWMVETVKDNRSVLEGRQPAIRQHPMISAAKT